MADRFTEPERLHAATIVIDVLKVLARLVWFVAALLLLRFFGGEGQADAFEIFVVALAGLGIVGTFVRVATLRYHIEGQRLIVRRGLVFREVRAVPIDRIQNVHARRTLLHRMLGVADLRVDTGVAGNKEEVELSALGRDHATALRQHLLALAGRIQPVAAIGTTPDTSPANDDGTDDDDAPDGPPVPGQLIARTDVGELMIAGATANIFGLALAVIGTGLSLVWTTDGKIVRPVTAFIEQATGPIDEFTATATALFMLAIAFGLVLISWLGSIALAVIRWYDFTLSRTGDDLHRMHGLLTREDQTVPLRRVQRLTVSQPWLRRWLGYSTISVGTAGSATADGENRHAMITPLVRTAHAPGFARHVFPDLQLETIDWQSVHPCAIYRGFVRFTLLLGVPLLVIAYLTLEPLLCAGLVVVLPIAWWLTQARYRSLAWCLTDRFVLARGGIVTRRTEVVPREKVQGAIVSQNPFQRRYGVSTLTVHTAAGEAHVVDLAVPIAHWLADQLSRSANEAARGLADAV